MCEVGCRRVARKWPDRSRLDFSKVSTTLREEAVKAGVVAADFDAIVVPARMIGPDPV
jgi:hypothetical protein